MGHVPANSMKSKNDDGVKRRIHRIFLSIERTFNKSGENFPKDSLPLIDVMVSKAQSPVG